MCWIPVLSRTRLYQMDKIYFIFHDCVFRVPAAPCSNLAHMELSILYMVQLTRWHGFPKLPRQPLKVGPYYSPYQPSLAFLSRLINYYYHEQLRTKTLCSFFADNTNSFWWAGTQSRTSRTIETLKPGTEQQIILRNQPAIGAGPAAPDASNADSFPAAGSTSQASCQW